MGEPEVASPWVHYNAISTRLEGTVVAVGTARNLPAALAPGGNAWLAMKGPPHNQMDQPQPVAFGEGPRGRVEDGWSSLPKVSASQWCLEHPQDDNPSSCPEITLSCAQPPPYSHKHTYTCVECSSSPALSPTAACAPCPVWGGHWRKSSDSAPSLGAHPGGSNSLQYCCVCSSLLSLHILVDPP